MKRIIYNNDVNKSYYTKHYSVPPYLIYYFISRFFTSIWREKTFESNDIL